MKNLNEYIKESILDDEDEVMNRINPSIIDQFLKNNYNLKNCTYTIDNNIVNVKGLIQVKRNKLKELTQLTNGFFKFGEAGVFYCNDCEKLINLEGAPKIVNGTFDCSGCINLKSLKGAPEKVGENFYCEDCEKLTNLEGAPKIVNGTFDCSGSNIKDLTNISTIVKNIDCSWCLNLTSLKGLPNNIPGYILANGCDKLKSLKDCPKKIGKYIKISISYNTLINELQINNFNLDKIEIKRTTVGPSQCYKIIFK